MVWYGMVWRYAEVTINSQNYIFYNIGGEMLQVDGVQSVPKPACGCFFVFGQI